MSPEGTVTIDHVWKRFRSDRGRRLLRDHVSRLGRRVSGREDADQWRWVLREIDFKIEPGESVGFVGSNGAGKSTTMKMITGFIPASQGDIRVCGIPVSVDSIETRKRIGYLPENNPLYLDMYVKEYLEFIGGIHTISNLKFQIFS